VKLICEHSKNINKNIHERQDLSARTNHWVAGMCLIFLATVGLFLVSSMLYPLSALFWDGEITCTFHPWIRVILLDMFCGLFMKFAGRAAFDW
jgi:cytochrome b subunit of formate dehydrogenase